MQIIKGTVEKWRTRSPSHPIEELVEMVWSRARVQADLSLAVWEAFSPGCNPKEFYPALLGKVHQVREDIQVGIDLREE